MSDRFGAQQLPALVGEINPRLATLGAFVRAVLVAECQTAWAAVAPAEPNEIVAKVFAEDPVKCPFIDKELPALFAYDDGGSFEDLGEGYVRHKGKVGIKWLFPPAMRERKRTIDLVGASLARAVAARVSDGRHPSWVHEDDEAQPEAIRVSSAAPVADTTYSGATLDGPIGANAWPALGRLLITITGTWDDSLPFVATTVREDGVIREENIYPTSATVEAAWLCSQVVSVEVPGGNTGTFLIGIALAPGCEYGSELQRHLGANRVRCTKWERREVQIPRRDSAPMRYDAVCFDVEIEETRTRSAEAMGISLLDEEASGIGLSGEIVSLGGMTVEVEDE